MIVLLDLREIIKKNMAKNWKTYWKHRKWKTNPERQEITEQIGRIDTTDYKH